VKNTKKERHWSSRNVKVTIARRTLRRALTGPTWFRSAAGPQVKISHDCICKLGVELRMIEKTSWTDYVRNEEALPRVNEQRNILHEKQTEG
jgi:hypothetical protein